MNIKSFFKLVEIQTKVASVIPYLLGTIFAMYYFEEFNFLNAIILFLSMFIFDMTTTAINNFMDYKKALKKEGYGYEEHNAIVRDGLKASSVKSIIFIMLIISSVLGVLLVVKTNFIVLLIGIVCFAIGILYSFGPIPISRTPFGEIFSGVTMGFAITFLAVYVHVYDSNIVNLSLIDGIVSLNLNIADFVSVFLISLPVICGISNIMLANNICDVEEDIVNKRYTLPIYIGKDNALILFKVAYYVGFAGILVSVLLGILPWMSILALIVLKPVNDNIKQFEKLQTKKDTFVLSVKNFVLTNMLYIITLILGIILR